MKKILFLVMSALAFMGNVNAQKTVDFKLQADGSFVNSSDGKNFVVIPFDGKTKDELYSETLVAVTKLYNSPKDVISKVEGEVISINGISQNCVVLKAMMGIKVAFSIQYVLQFQFKEGKLRVDAPVISRFFSDTAADISPFSGWLEAQSVFKKGKANPKKQGTIDDFNNTLNGLINNIISNMGNKSEDNW
jgi:hypothetical protein|nr:MAG TPA: protein of unknown function (DUF4468) [Caudoviricetes sp.]